MLVSCTYGKVISICADHLPRGHNCPVLGNKLLWEDTHQNVRIFSWPSTMGRYVGPSLLVRPSQYSTDTILHTLQSKPSTIVTYRHQHCQRDPPASPTQQLDHSKLLPSSSASRHHHRSPARPLTPQVPSSIHLSTSQLHHSHTETSRQQWHLNRTPSPPFARPGRGRSTHRSGSGPGSFPTISTSTTCRLKSAARLR
jgi:hypothetical protein